MNVVVHYPKTLEGQQELARRVAECHAEAVGILLRKMNITNEDRRKVIAVMCERLKEQTKQSGSDLIPLSSLENTQDMDDPEETLSMTFG